jgi:hypothetical protein
VDWWRPDNTNCRFQFPVFNFQFDQNRHAENRRLKAKNSFPGSRSDRNERRPETMKTRHAVTNKFVTTWLLSEEAQIMNEKPIERLNYYNGQRLEAGDLKLEQEYHIRVRRWLNQSLYSPGIARGLEVRAEDGLNVVVKPGLALDFEGREIILLEEQRKPVIGKHNRVGSVDLGFYLTIQYREQTIAEEQGGCTPKNGGRKKAGGSLAWGGPSRVLAEPILGWSDVLPHESSGKIVLARVLLDEKCENIQSVQTDVRRYIGASSASQVRQYALEGERDVDSNNSGRIYFHIRGRQPSAVTLYLRAEKFSTLYYTEMGWHGHSLSVAAGVETTSPIYHPDPANPEKYMHSHTLTHASTDGGTDHEHSILEVTFAGAHSTDSDCRLQVGTSGYLDTPVYNDILPVLSAPLGQITGWSANPFDPPQRGTPFKARVAGASSHTHTLTGETDKIQVTDDHTHNVNPTASLGQAGVTDPDERYSARGGDPLHPPDLVENPVKPLTYIDNLQIYIGKVDVDGKRPDPGLDDNYTAAILDQLKNAQPAIYGGKSKLGEGHGDENDPLANNGTGPIKLDFLQGLSFDEGEYYIELKVDSGGGRILYNLYVE